MEEMVEPDRTIMIVSIIALVIIWGSVAYHKFVQDGGGVPDRPEYEPVKMQAGKTDAIETSSSGSGDGGKARSSDTGKQRGKKREKKKR